MKPNQMASLLTHLPRLLAGVGVAFGMSFKLNTTAPSTLEAPFTQITSGPVVTQAALWMTPAWGDYDNDGWVDLFVANFSNGGQHALFHNNRDGTFSRIMKSSSARRRSEAAMTRKQVGIRIPQLSNVNV